MRFRSQNILLGKDGSAKIADAGTASALHSITFLRICRISMHPVSMPAADVLAVFGWAASELHLPRLTMSSCLTMKRTQCGHHTR